MACRPSSAAGWPPQPSTKLPLPCALAGGGTQAQWFEGAGPPQAASQPLPQCPELNFPAKHVPGRHACITYCATTTCNTDARCKASSGEASCPVLRKTPQEAQCGPQLPTTHPFPPPLEVGFENSHQGWSPEPNVAGEGSCPQLAARGDNLLGIPRCARLGTTTRGPRGAQPPTPSLKPTLSQPCTQAALVCLLPKSISKARPLAADHQLLTQPAMMQAQMAPTPFAAAEQQQLTGERQPPLQQPSAQPCATPSRLCCPPFPNPTTAC